MPVLAKQTNKQISKKTSSCFLQCVSLKERDGGQRCETEPAEEIRADLEHSRPDGKRRRTRKGMEGHNN